jgi:hypothetical protein
LLSVEDERWRIAMTRPVLAAALLAAALASCSHTGGGGGSGTAPMTAPEVRQLLIDQGYADIEDLHATGQDWTAAATRNGKAVQVTVDRYGIIHIE